MRSPPPTCAAPSSRSAARAVCSPAWNTTARSHSSARCTTCRAVGSSCSADERAAARGVSTPAAAPVAAASALHYQVFRWLWIATVVSNVGTWMYNAASGWLMTSLNPSPLVVSLVQVATSLPLFLLALPAGAFADILDKRRLIVALEMLTSVFSAVFALLVTLHAVTPALLLLFTFLVGVLGALEMPAWQAIVPLLVPQSALSSAVASNSVGVNISRVIGPALCGMIILGLGIAAPFWLDALSNAGVIAVILWWRPPLRPARSLPPEHFLSAIRTGVDRKSVV